MKVKKNYEKTKQNHSESCNKYMPLNNGWQIGFMSQILLRDILFLVGKVNICNILLFIYFKLIDPFQNK